MRTATAFAPASVGNVAVGFDVLGHALTGPGDRCTATRTDQPGVRIVGLRGLSCAVPGSAGRNTAGRAAQSLLAAVAAEFGIDLVLDKGIPLGSGMGGSAASAVAAVVAVNALLSAPLAREALMIHAMAGEALASGGRPHADNIAPSLFGGLTLVQADETPRVCSIPAPSGIVCVLAHPHCQINTSIGRAVLSNTVPLDRVIDEIAALSGFLAGCFRDDRELLSRSLRDPIIEAQRAHLVPGFYDVQKSALDCGALGCSLSGSGPSLFAWADVGDAARVGAAMRAAFAAHGLACDYWISPIDAPGARVEAA